MADEFRRFQRIDSSTDHRVVFARVVSFCYLFAEAKSKRKENMQLIARGLDSCLRRNDVEVTGSLTRVWDDEPRKVLLNAS